MKSLKSDSFFKFNPNTLEDVRKNYNLEQPGAIDDAVNILEEWLKKQEHFINKTFDKEFLEKTIIRAKGSLERAKYRLDRLCSAKTLLPAFFVVDEVKGLDFVEDLFLPRPTSDNYRLYLMRSRGKVDDSFYINYFTRGIQYYEYQYANDYGNGMDVILDYREANLMGWVKGFDAVALQNMLKLTVECYGLRIKAIHMISPSKSIELLVALFKQILSAKLGSRIRVHNTLDSVYEYVEKDILPADYGGSEKPLSELHREFLQEIKSDKHKEHMKKMFAAGTNEEYRTADKCYDQSIPGTFRDLRVD